MLISSFDTNTIGTDYIVGDIHASFSKLCDCLNNIGFNYEKDRLFCTGDLVDRGPEPELALEWLDYPWFNTVMGNHEDMALHYFYKRENWNIFPNYKDRNGNGWFIDSSEEEQYKYVQKFEKLPLAIEIAYNSYKIGIVHAEIESISWEGFKSNIDRHTVMHSALWGRNIIRAYYGINYNPFYLDNVLDIDVICHGHSIIPKPVKLGNRLYIDTGGYYKKFTIMSLQECLDFTSPINPIRNRILKDDF